MDVDNTNFQEALQIIRDIIQNNAEKKCEFVSFDFEMTGIKGQPDNYDDLPFERYSKYKKVVQKYGLIQAGLCFFRKLKENEYEALPFNFYIFQRENKQKNPIIGLESGAISFNCKHNMDFNRWLYKGITYVQQQSIKKLSEFYIFKAIDDEKYQEKSDDLIIKCNEEQQKKCNDWFFKLKEWYNNKDQKQILIEEPNGFLRKIIHYYLEEQFSDCIKKNNDQNKSITLVKATPEEKKQYAIDEEKKQQQDLENAVGFTRVIELLIQSKIPIVGHNCIMDLLFLYNGFIGRLPKDYYEWKAQVNNLFPTIIDNKYVIRQFSDEWQLNSTVLEEIHKYMNKNPQFEALKITCPQGFDDYNLEKSNDTQQEEELKEGDAVAAKNQQNRYHEAGFDAYLTGWVYKKAIFMKNLQEQELKNVKNKLYLYSSYYTLNFGQQLDERQNQNQIFVLRTEDFDKNLTKYQVLQKTQKSKELLQKHMLQYKEIIEIRIFNNFLLVIEIKENKECKENKELSENHDWLHYIQGIVTNNKLALKVQNYKQFYDHRLKVYNDELKKFNDDEEY